MTVSREYEPAPDFLAHNTVRHIKRQYDDMVSFHAAFRNLATFGRTFNADIGIKTTIGTFPGAVVNETYVNTNLITQVVSDNASDTETLVCVSFSIDGDGLLTREMQEVTLTGQTPVNLPVPVARFCHMYVKAGTFASPASDLVGNVYAFEGAQGATLGVPDVDSSVHCMIRAGQNAAEKCCLSTQHDEYWLLAEGHAAMGRTGSSTNADVEIEVRTLGGVFISEGIEVALRSASSVFEHFTLRPPIIVPPNSDVRGVVTATANDTPIGMRIEGIVAKVVG